MTLENHIANNERKNPMFILNILPFLKFKKGNFLKALKFY